MKEIYLHHGEITLVNDDDYESLNKYNWYLYSIGYVETSIKHKTIYMHRLILNAPAGIEVDHINGNLLDNRKSNLRLCTHQQNSMNRKRRITNISGYKGVSWHKVAQKWHARIKIDQKNIELGYYDNIIEAAKAYDAAACRIFGSFAKTNF